MSRNFLLEKDVKSEVQVNAMGFKRTTTQFINNTQPFSQTGQTWLG